MVEILVVVTIMGIVSGIIGISVINHVITARVDTAKIQMKTLDDALGTYRLKFHDYPSTVDGLNALVQPKQGLPLMSEIPKDPWDNDYIYTYPSQYSRHAYDIMSKGPDGTAGTQDDVIGSSRGANAIASSR